MRRTALGLTCALLLTGHGFRDVPSQAPATVERPRRMSFHNRLLLNRAVLAGLRSMEVLLLLKEPPKNGNGAAAAAIAAAVARLGGRIRKTEGDIGYLRIELPPERLIELVASPSIDAYQISSLSRGSWYRDGPPVANAQMFRGFEVTPIGATEPANNYSHLPTLTPAEAQDPGFTADHDVGVGQWSRDHPTFDGRGVTIAVLETALPSFADPVFRTAKTLDGREVPKIAGILNAIDPESVDDTRVRLTARVDAPKSWTRFGSRTYIMPRPGTYWVGTLDVPAGANVLHHFAVIEDDVTREIWIDANGDASFQDEQPLADVNERFDPRVLKLTFPRKVDVSFVMSRAHEPHVAHIYLGTSDHQTMTASVAAGNRSDESLASGVAPNARLLFVRMHDSTYGVANLLEGFIQAAKRPEVDVLTASAGISMVPDTDGDFVGLLFRRLTTKYQKPIVTSAGNFGLMLGHVSSHGGALSAGGTLGPATYAALHGGRPLSRLIVHPASAAGPALDGAIKPDFLAPVERIAANPPWDTNLEAAPENARRRVAHMRAASSLC
jgi:Subtilase family